MRRSVLALLVGSSLALGGCVASIAAGVVGAAVRAANAGGPAEPDVDLRDSARLACTAHAARYGNVHIIDAEQGRGRRTIVWGTVQDVSQRRSFECHYDGRVTSFRLRAITQRSGTTP